MPPLDFGAEITKRPVLASFDEYAGAQKAVDTLSDNHFPVQHVAIVGVDLRLVESVLGRMSWARAAVGGMATFAWLGVLVGLFVSFFASQDMAPTQLVLLGLLYGAGFGIVFGLVSYAFTRGKRDFISRQALQAARYDVLCDTEQLPKARNILGLASAWPPAVQPGSSAPPVSGPAGERPNGGA
ncbi:MAG: general stress protein [Candidatus Nanopelagicales bacterium]|nr:general stress protein [Candidatus Nanopelagicales bacterium]